MTLNHTPTPWYVSGLRNVCANATQGGALTGALQDHVALAETGEDAAYIVRCVNAHDELVAALRATSAALEAVLNDPSADTDSAHSVATFARAALAKAQA